MPRRPAHTPFVAIVAGIALATSVGVVHPLAAIGLVLVWFLARPRARRAPWAPRPEAFRRVHGMHEVWQLHGLSVRFDAHEVRIRGRHGLAIVSVHDLAGATAVGGRVFLVRQDGRRVEIGRSLADATSLAEAVRGLDQAIRVRTRGALEDRAAMHRALATAGMAQKVGA